MAHTLQFHVSSTDKPLAIIGREGFNVLTPNWSNVFHRQTRYTQTETSVANLGIINAEIS